MVEQSSEDAADDRWLVVSHAVRIPKSEFKLTFSRSSGPGGQNVNKTNSKVTLSWPVVESAYVPDEVKSRFLQQQRTRVTTEGVFVFSSQRHRDQPRNIEDCYQKLAELLQVAAHRPKTRRPTRPTKASKRRRLGDKRRKSLRKQDRREPRGDD